MKFRHAAALALLATASTVSLADTVTTPLDLSLGNTSFGRNNAIGSFVDTYTFTLTGSSFFVTSTASSAAAGLQDLDFTSLVIRNAANTVVATFAGNLGNDITEFYALSPTLLTAGSYRLIVSGVNSPTQASYTGDFAVTATPVPEPSTSALMLAGLGAAVFVMRRRKTA